MPGESGTTSAARGARGSEAYTPVDPLDPSLGGVRVRVTPGYDAARSDPHRPLHVYTYRVRIDNAGRAAVRLLSRHWVIVDAHGRRQEVRGEGVVGVQPTIPPGGAHEYGSLCPLATRWGTMEGAYRFRRADGVEFEAGVARFYLVAPVE